MLFYKNTCIYHFIKIVNKKRCLFIDIYLKKMKIKLNLNKKT